MPKAIAVLEARSLRAGRLTERSRSEGLTYADPSTLLRDPWAKAIAVLDADGFTDFRPKNYENLAVSLILEHQDWSYCRKQLPS